MAQVLVARGFDTTEAKQLTKSSLADLHDPSLLPGLDEAADRLAAAVREKRAITVYGDYDVDGMTATAILLRCLRLAGGQVDYYIPHRLDEGYSLNESALRQIAAEDPNRLIVTVDCGIASLAEARLARELGLELIVTDHHQFAADLPDALAVHPRLKAEPPYPFGELCGAGVALKLAWGVAKRLNDGRRVSDAQRDTLIEAVGLACLGTVADLVPMRGENRVIVCNGLKALSSRCRPGLQALKAIAKLEGPLATDDLSYALSPRLNAAGRLGQARLGVELLVTDDAMRAHDLARYIDELNDQRKTVERRISRQAREQVDENPEWEAAPALVLSQDDWHYGVTGIVAGRIVEKYGRPAFLLSLDKATGRLRGSGRSGGMADLHAALGACSDLLETHGGHAAAAGVSLQRENLPAFRERLGEEVLAQHAGRPPEAPLSIDAEVALGLLDLGAVKELERLSPFGQQHPRPLLVASGVRLSKPPRAMGEGDRHFSAQFRQGGRPLRSIAFGRGEWVAEMSPDEAFDICFEPQINSYQGRESVELRLVDWRRSTL